MRFSRYDYYSTAACGGAMPTSGKGNGPGRGGGQRHQKVIAFPAWKKTGSDVYFSSRWEFSKTHGDTQMYDLYHTNKNMHGWWQTLPWEWVWLMEIPYDINAGEFDWTDVKSHTWWEIEKRREQQKKEFQKAVAKNIQKKAAAAKKKEFQKELKKTAAAKKEIKSCL